LTCKNEGKMTLNPWRVGTQAVVAAGIGVGMVVLTPQVVAGAVIVGGIALFAGATGLI
jgi:hypothetical protein